MNERVVNRERDYSQPFCLAMRAASIRLLALSLAIDKMRIMCGLATSKTETVSTVLHKKIKAQSYERLDMRQGVIEAKVKPSSVKSVLNPDEEVRTDGNVRVDAGRTDADDEMPPPVTPKGSEYVYTPSDRSTKTKGAPINKKITKPLPNFNE